jgi:ribosomal protein L40E
MDFLEDLLDFGDRKRRKNGGLFPQGNRGGIPNNRDHHDDDHYDDDHDHHQQYPANSNQQAPANSQFPVNQQFPANPAAALSGVICPKCSTPTLQGAKFCHGCGTVIGVLLNCASCGSQLPANAPFCPQCGYNNK